MRIQQIGLKTLAPMVVCQMVLVAGLAQAASLNLTLQDTPDIVSGFIDVNYDAVTDAFTATGFAFQIDAPPVEAIVGGTFDLKATIDDNGNLLGGSLVIGGTVANLGFNSGALLTGTLTAFGFPDLGDEPLEFLFNVTGGDAAGLYGSTAGTVLTQSGFNGSFDSDFRNVSAGNANTAAVPVPMALPVGVAMLGLMGLVSIGRKTARRASA